MRTHAGAGFAFTLTLCLGITMACAQPGRGNLGLGGAAPRGPKLSGAMTKLFGENSSFGADLEVEANDAGGQKMVTPGRLVYDQGKMRLELDLGRAKSASIAPEVSAQMSAMGMDKMVVISRPDQKRNYVIYPGLKAYAETVAEGAEDPQVAESFKVRMTELGRETVNGHPTIKHKAVVTEADGKVSEALVWNATDLKKFPVRIEQKESDTLTVVNFKNVDFARPAAAQFDLPSGMTKYDSLQTMMQEEMMKKFGAGGMGAQPGMAPGMQPRKQRK
jgi:hypothetical protein